MVHLSVMTTFLAHVELELHMVVRDGKKLRSGRRRHVMRCEQFGLTGGCPSAQR